MHFARNPGDGCWPPEDDDHDDHIERDATGAHPAYGARNRSTMPLPMSDSGELLAIYDMDTQKLVPLERGYEIRTSRSRRQDEHLRLARRLREDAATLQQTIYAMAEQLGELYVTWTRLHAAMEPTLEQIRSMQELDFDIAHHSQQQEALKRQYERAHDDADQHERAGYALSQPFGGGARAGGGRSGSGSGSGGKGWGHG